MKKKLLQRERYASKTRLFAQSSVKREAFFFNSDIRAGAAIGGRSHLSLSISANCFHENDTFSLAVASLGAASIMSPP